MRDLIKGGVALLIVAILLALIQSCSMDNGILKPGCNIFEVDLDEKWWHPEGNPAESSLYFRANGLLNIEGQTDSISFRMENCNKIKVSNISSGNQELWVIKSITADNLSIDYPDRGKVAYGRTR